MPWLTVGLYANLIRFNLHRMQGTAGEWAPMQQTLVYAELVFSSTSRENVGTHRRVTLGYRQIAVRALTLKSPYMKGL